MRAAPFPIVLLSLSLLSACESLSLGPGQTDESPYPQASGVASGTLETVHLFNDQMPTGVTVSHDGRIFVCYPRWNDPIRFTVAEIRGDQEVAYPDLETNTPDNPDRLYSVQSVVVDPRNRLWVLDTGSLNLGPIRGQDWAKLVCIDLSSNRIIRTIRFPADVVLPTTYLNDVRFDLRRGREGAAFITDSSGSGPNALIVVDLATGRSWRKLNDHPSVKAEKDFRVIMEGQPLMIRKPGEPPKPLTIGSDGIAISADGLRLFYCPLASRDLYSVSVDALLNERMADGEVANTLRRETRRFPSDGLESDAQDRVYLTDWEHNAIAVRDTGGQFFTLVADPRMWWPDTLSLSGNYLYFTCNQLHRQPQFHDGRDLRQKPYALFRIKVNASPVMLK